MSENSEIKTEEKRNAQIVRGRVVSDKMNKTRVIEIAKLVDHPLYQKKMRRIQKLFVHDEKNESHVGDLVLAVGCRPLSKNKSFRLRKILERAGQ